MAAAESLPIIRRPWWPAAARFKEEHHGRPVPQPVRDADAARGGRVAGPVRVLVGVQRGPPGVRGVGVLVHGRRALPRGDPAVGRHHRGVRADRAVAVQHQALRDPARPRRGHALPERLHVPLPRRRDRPEGDRGPDPRICRTGRVLLRQLGPAVRGVGAQGPRAHRRARDDQLLAAAGARGHGGHHRGPRHRQRARPAVHLPPAGRPDPEAVAAPLRVPQPRLRRLPGLLRLLQAAVPVHPGPGDRQDGGRHPGRPVPAGRRGQEAGPARGRARDRRTGSRARSRPSRCWPGCAATRRATSG